MIRLLVLGMVLALAALVVACGGDDSTKSVTPSVAAPSGSTADTGTPTETPGTPTPVPTPTPTPFTNWQVSGQFSGGAYVQRNFCNVSSGSYKVSLSGKLNDIPIGVVINSDTAGAIDFSQASSGVTVAIQYGGSVGTATNAYWYAMAGDSGASGTLTIGNDGSGNVELTVPPSPGAPAGATAPITVTGPWICT